MAPGLRRRRPWVALLLSLTTLGVYDLAWLRSTLLDAAALLGHRPRILRWWLLLGLYVLLVFAPLLYLDQAVRQRSADGYLTDLRPTVYAALALLGLFSVARGFTLWTAAREVKALQRLVGEIPIVPPLLHLLAIPFPPVGAVTLAAAQGDLNRLAAFVSPQETQISPEEEPWFRE